MRPLPCLLLAAFLIAACAPDEEPTNAPRPALDVTITASATTVSRDAPIRIEVTASNRGDALVRWGAGSSSCQLGLRIESETSGQDVSLAVPCTMDMVDHELAPGASRSESWTWNATAGLGSEEPVPPGRYRLVGFAGESESDALMVRVQALE